GPKTGGAGPRGDHPLLYPRRLVPGAGAPGVRARPGVDRPLGLWGRENTVRRGLVRAAALSPLRPAKNPAGPGWVLQYRCPVNGSEPHDTAADTGYSRLAMRRRRAKEGKPCG